MSTELRDPWPLPVLLPSAPGGSQRSVAERVSGAEASNLRVPAGRSRWRRDDQTPDCRTASRTQSTLSTANVSSRETNDEQLVVPEVERRDTKTQALATSDRLQTPGAPHDAVRGRTVPPHTDGGGVPYTTWREASMTDHRSRIHHGHSEQNRRESDTEAEHGRHATARQN